MIASASHGVVYHLINKEGASGFILYVHVEKLKALRCRMKANGRQAKD